MGQLVVVLAVYRLWEAEDEFELCADSTAEFLVYPDEQQRLDGVGSEQHVVLGRMSVHAPWPETTAKAGIHEMTWWDVDKVLRLTPEQFAQEVAVFNEGWPVLVGRA